jgi:ATP-binding cassette subfamily B protein RaxB
MVASAHGHRIDINEIRHRFHVSIKGTTLPEIVTFARALGLSARALRIELTALPRVKSPAILHMDMNHFVVLKEMRGTDAIIHDPASGIRRLTREQLDRRFTGIALELTPNSNFQRKAAEPKLQVFELAGGLPLARGVMPKALVLSLALQTLVLAAPFYVQLVIDRAVTQGRVETLLPLAVGFALLIVLRGALGWVRARTLLAFSGQLNAQLVINVVSHMLRLPHAWFESRHVSALLSRVSSTQPIRDLIAAGLAAAVVDGLMAVLTIILAVLFAPVLAIIVLTGFVANALVKVWQVRSSVELEHEFIEAFAKAQQEFIETVRAIATVKLFRKEAERQRRWLDRHIESVNARYASDFVKAQSELARDCINASVLCAVVYAGAVQVISGSLSLGMLMAFITYQQIFSDSASKLLDFAARFRLLDVHLQRIADVVRSETEADHSLIRGDAVMVIDGRISGRDLSYRYGDLEQPIFSGINFDIAAGEFVAITGSSGGGKTTLLKLLIGLLEPSTGYIEYDGQPLRTLGVETIRDRIGVVMQADVLLSGSIAQNITFYDASPDVEWMQECARMAAIHDDVIKFSMGYNTLIGDMGSSLSGGQKQRVLLARALYRRPSILFMDEGTSSLDTEKETEVNRNLRGLRITRVVIAHRKDTIDAADRILEFTPTELKERIIPQRADR